MRCNKGDSGTIMLNRPEKYWEFSVLETNQKTFYFQSTKPGVETRHRQLPQAVTVEFEKMQREHMR